MEQLVRVLMLLIGNRSYTIIEIAEKFEKSERTIFRYLEAIEGAGFVLEKAKNGSADCRYRLQTSGQTKSLKKLLHFSEEEAWTLYQMLTELKVGSPFREQLVNKLNFLYDFNVLSKLENTQNLEWISFLNEAISQKKKVRLVQYRSSNTSIISDRLVEPFEFMKDYEGVWCYEIESKQNKQFKISRIQEVEMLNEHWGFESAHVVPFTDAFRMAAEKPVAQVKARLSLKAYNLLREEYPLTEKFITPENQEYMLSIPLADYQGFGRFVLGLCGEIEIIEPEAFKNFLKEKISLFH